MIGKQVWVLTGPKMGYEGTVLADNKQGEYLVDFGGRHRLQLSERTLIFRNTCWIKHTNVEEAEGSI